MKSQLPLCSSPTAFDLMRRQVVQMDSPDALLNGAIAISMHQLEHVDPTRIDRIIQSYADTVRNRVRGAQPQALVAHLHEFLFEDQGLTGNTDDTPDGRYANPAWFTAPSPGAWGDAGRNSIRGPKTFSLNAAIARTFRLGDRINMDWRVDATNVLNRLTYTRITTLVTSPEFGLPSSTNDVRKLRTSVRLRF